MQAFVRSRKKTIAVTTTRLAQQQHRQYQTKAPRKATSTILGSATAVTVEQGQQLLAQQKRQYVHHYDAIVTVQSGSINNNNNNNNNSHYNYRYCSGRRVFSSSSSSSSSSSAVVPATTNNDNVPSTMIDFQVSSKIEGEESHVAIIELKPGEILRAEAGAMLYMTEGIVMETKLEGVSSAFTRMLTGQNMFLTDFRYDPSTTSSSASSSSSSGTVALGTDFPSKILRFSLEDYGHNGGGLICQRGAYLASNATTVNIEMEFTKSFTSGFFGGEGFILQKLTGQGDVLIKGGGTIVRKDLEENETLRVTSGSIVAFEPTVQYDVQMMPGIKNAMFGGEGLFVTTLRGPGQIWLQGMSPDRMIAEIARRVPSGSGLGLGIPIGVGGSGGAETSSDDDAAAAAAADDDGMDAAVEEEIDADRLTTSSVQDDNSIDSESQSALFGDAVPPSDHDPSDTTTTGSSSSSDDDGFFGEDDSTNPDDDFSTFSSGGSTGENYTEPTFTDDEFSDPNDQNIADGEIYGDETSSSDEGQSLDGEEGGASSVLSTLWDFFTGGDD